MTRRLCFYSRRTNAELKAMYKARTGRDMPETKKRMTKKDLSNELRKVDRRPWNYGPEFLFQDLPAEMRNMIYREMLPTSRDEKCSTAILRVCKQVHSEARGILYGDHEGQTLIRTCFDDGIFPPLDRTTTVFSSISRAPPCNVAKLANNRKSWPSYLIDFESINIIIDSELYFGATVTGWPELHAATNQDLLGLVSVLSRSSVLKSLRLTIRATAPSTQMPNDLWMRVLLPLTSIHPRVKIEMFDVPQEVDDQILRERETRTDSKHFFADFQETHASLKELEAFRASVDPKDTLLSIKAQEAVMENALDVSGFIDDKVEKQLRETTAKAKVFLASGVVDKVNRLARRKTKEMKEETAKKISELEGLGQKFVEVEKVAKNSFATTTA